MHCLKSEEFAFVIRIVQELVKKTQVDLTVIIQPPMQYFFTPASIVNTVDGVFKETDPPQFLANKLVHLTGLVSVFIETDEIAYKRKDSNDLRRTLVDTLVSALSHCTGGHASEHSCIPKNIASGFYLDEDYLRAVMENNDWLVVLFLLLYFV